MNEIKEKDIKNSENLTEEKEKNEFSATDIEYIRECMDLAAEAEAIDEVPVGAMIVRDGVVLARAFNTRESSKCATHHAEILAIEKACAVLGGWRLPGVTLYVSMEPCAMCAGAIINARIPRVVYGARDYRFGAFGSLVDLSKIPFNHIPEVVGGVLADECSGQLTAYFRKKRDKSSITC
jgi:tRNA(adenine34) deaminase